MFTTTEADPIMKEVILPGIREFLNNATVLLKHVERETQPNLTGEFIIAYNKTQNNNAGAGRIEDETLPAAYKSTFTRSTVGSKLLYTRAKWTGKVIAATSSKEAMVSALVNETKRATIATKTSLNRQLNGDGRDKLGTYVSGAGGTAVVVTDEWGNIGADAFMSGDTVVDLVNGEDNTINEADIVLTRGVIGATGRAMVADANLSATASAPNKDYFILKGTLTGVVRRQVLGIQALISSGNSPIEGAAGLQGLPVATNPDFTATQLGNDSAYVDLQFHKMQQVLSELDMVSDGGQEGVKFIYTSPAGYDTYVKTCKDAGIALLSMELDGGFKGVSFNGRLPVVSDRFCRRGAFYFINPSSMKLFQLSDFHWADKQGTMFYLLDGGDKDGYGANLQAYLEFGVIERNANGVLVGQNMIW